MALFYWPAPLAYRHIDMPWIFKRVPASTRSGDRAAAAGMTGRSEPVIATRFAKSRVDRSIVFVRRRASDNITDNNPNPDRKPHQRLPGLEPSPARIELYWDLEINHFSEF